MATIYDLIELTGVAANTSYSSANGGILGIVDGATGTELDDGEFDEGDLFTIGGTVYTIDLIQEPASTGSFLLGDGSQLFFGPQSEANLDVMFLTVSNGTEVRHFALPNDRYGDMQVQAVQIAAIEDVAGSDAAVIGTTDDAVKFVCFCAGTRIGVAGGGSLPVEALAEGHLVATRDRGPQPLRWIGSRALGPLDLLRHPRRRPVHIPAGALGEGYPEADLLVSRQHRIVVRSAIARRMFDTDEVLVPAAFLVGVNGIGTSDRLRPLRYFHLLFGRHEIVLANGAWAESLLPATEAFAMLDALARQRITTIVGQDPRPVPARRLASGAAGRRLVARHARNGKRLYA